MYEREQHETLLLEGTALVLLSYVYSLCPALLAPFQRATQLPSEGRYHPHVRDTIPSGFQLSTLATVDPALVRMSF